jgi:lipoteichoic acid synthase
LNIKEYKISMFRLYLLGIAIQVLKVVIVSIVATSGDEFAKIALQKNGMIPVMFLLQSLYVIVFFSITLLFKGKKKILAYISVSFILSIIMFVDLIYIRAFERIPSIRILQQMNNLHNLEGSILFLIKTTDFFVFLDIVVIGVVFLIGRKLFKKEHKIKIKPINYKVYILLAIISIAGIKTITSETFYDTMKWNENQLYVVTGPFYLHTVDIYNYFFEETEIKLSNQEKEKINESLNRQQEYNNEDDLKGILKDKNIFFVQIESMENFVIGNKIGKHEITPFINSLLNESIYFDNFVEQINVGGTLDCLFISNTGLYPLSKDVVSYSFPNNKFISIPYILGKFGYNSVMLHADKPFYWNYKNMSKSLGFNKFYYDEHFNVYEDLVINMGLGDKSFFKQSLDILENEKKPIYAYLIGLTGHAPFQIPDKDVNFSIGNELEKGEIYEYLKAMKYVDEAIEVLFDELKEKDLLKESAIILLGDHKSISKYAEEEMREFSNQYKWGKNGRKVPLIIFSEGLEGRRISTIGGQVDIPKTLLYLMGIDENEYENRMLGKNLILAKEGYVVLPNGEAAFEDDTNEKNSLYLEELEISELIIRGNYFNYLKDKE